MDPQYLDEELIRSGRPSNAQLSLASTLQEHDSLIRSYESLKNVPDPQEGLTRLRKIASLVKPIMRKRGWQVSVLAEFLPEDARLLGLNINHGYKICIRLRHSHAPGTFLPLEQTVDTMLHELSHIVFGPHDANFHRLWDELRDEHETLLMKGYTGEGFLTRGQRLGGGGPLPPQHEMRRLARANAEKRRVLTKGSGQRVGGKSIRPGQDARSVIIDAIERRNRVDKGCASGTADAGRLAQQVGQQIFKTKGEEDDANDRAIAEALLELMEEEETRKLEGTLAMPPASGGLAWTPEAGLFSAEDSKSLDRKLEAMSEEEQLEWAMKESMGSGESISRPIPIDSKPSPQAPKATFKPQSQALADSKATSRNRDGTPPIKRIRTTTADPARGPERSRTPSTGPGTLHQSSAAASMSTMSSTTSLPETSESQTYPDILTTSDSWTCTICTCINPLQYLACDACGIERPADAAAPIQRPSAGAAKDSAPKKKPLSNLSRSELPPVRQARTLGWKCVRCGTFMEHSWWSCSRCGTIKAESTEPESAVIL